MEPGAGLVEPAGGVTADSHATFMPTVALPFTAMANAIIAKTYFIRRALLYKLLKKAYKNSLNYYELKDFNETERLF